jgi:hypothetical protein
MSDLTSWLLNRGVTEDILLVLTFVPVLVTITSFSRYITGVKSFGLYTSIILSFAYYYMGFVQGFSIVLLVVFTSWIVRNMLRSFSLHYLSRLSIVYTVISIVVLAFIIGTSYIPSDNRYLDFTAISFLPLIMIISVADRFMASYIKKDLMTAARLTGETLVISFFGWVLLRWDVTHSFFLNNLWIIPVLILVNILIGQFSGLRGTEFLRFAQVIRHVESPENTPKK